MFTGIIEAKGQVLGIVKDGSNITFDIQTPLAAELKVDQSVAHNGVCLTVTAIDLSNGTHQVTAIAETLAKTNLGLLAEGDAVNVERCLQVGARLDGHFVQGHVDTVGTVKSIEPKAGSWEITISYPSQFAHLVVEKGSICLNGISLTIFGITNDTFKVAIIPYTWDHTNISSWQVGSTINIEFDIMGKYLARWRSLEQLTNL